MNSISGPIPNSISNYSQLRVLVVSKIKFNGHIPLDLRNLRLLEVLQLYDNNLTNTPSLSSQLNFITSLAYCRFLSRLVIGGNLLYGTIPASVENLSSWLKTFDASSSKLSGNIPIEIGNLSSLVKLNLYNNDLSGGFPLSIKHFHALQGLYLADNMLGGSILEATCDLHALSDIELSRNQFSGPIHKCLGNVSSLRNLFLGSNMLDSSIPSSLWGLERISYYELVQGIKQFNESNLLGTGSSCFVYKGVLNSGKVIAVKVFNMQLQGTSRIFDVECEMLRNIRHRNLTSVKSSCSNEEFKALVVEYMPKGNLEQWLYSHNYCLNVLQRLNIMIDVASALEYLPHGYSTPIVHSGMKPSNVLLDEDMVAHVSDFGISKLLSNGDNFVLTNTFATLGYIAPEYGLAGLVSTRCDVYSYDVMLMEAFTRKRPSDDIFFGDLNLESWVENSIAEMPDEVINANLVMDLEEEQLNKNMECASSILKVALKCSANSPIDRINMKEVLVEL